MARDRMDVTSFRRQGFLSKTTATSCGRITGTSYIEPGSPWENPYVESFGSRLRDELLSCEQFDTLLEAQVLIGDWKHECNTYRPRSSLAWHSPIAYAGAWKAENQVD